MTWLQSLITEQIGSLTLLPVKQRAVMKPIAFSRFDAFYVSISNGYVGDRKLIFVWHWAIYISPLRFSRCK
ncbi:hypothetical protein D1872_216620 [compost metagenome]